jgi:hypothetical protein
MLPKPPIRPRRVVFIAPLIGAGAAQSILVFRKLTRRGSILFSFEYRGHPRSTGVFDLNATVADVKHSLIWAWHYANDRNLPLHGLSTCFGTIPLLAQFVGDGCGVLLKSFTAACGLFRLHQILKLEDFAPVLSRHMGRELSSEAVLTGIAQCKFDCSGALFRRALHEFLGGMFPELRVEPDSFEELSYDRADATQSLRQFLLARYLDGVTVPHWLPCHFFYGRNDELLSVDTPAGAKAYTDHIRSLIPHADLGVFDIDHFGRGPERDVLIDHIGDLWEQDELKPVLPGRQQKVFHVGSVSEN